MARKKQTSNPIVLSDGSVDDGKGRIVTTSDGRKVKVDALASSEYWRRREARQQTKNIRDEQKIGEEMKKIYLRMFRESQTQIDAFYQRYADKNGITLAEARKRVNQMDINAYAAKAKKYVKDRDLSDQANEEMALYNLTMKVNRLEMLKAEMGMALVDGFEEMSGIIDRELTERAMSEYERKAGILGKTVQNPAAKAAAIVNASFHNATWSERLWSHQEALKTEIGRQLMSGLIAGKSSRDMAREIRKIFGGSLQNTQRLMVTELARVQTEAARQSMEANGNTEYEYMATGPHPCPECMKLDGEIFKLKEMQVGVNAPPLHPSCHCCTAPYHEDGGEKPKPRILTEEELLQRRISNRISSDKEQFERYRKVLKDIVPASLDEFQQLKYNNTGKWNTMKHNYRIVNSYEINAGSMSPKKILQLDEIAFIGKKGLFTGKAKSSANIGIMELDGCVYYGNSKATEVTDPAYYNFKGNRDQLVLMKPDDKRRFKTLIIGHDRKYDSEAKLFEFAADIVNDNKIHTVDLLSERCMCDSCLGVMEQFQKMYPNVVVNAVSGRKDRVEQNHNNPWGHRKHYAH